MKSKKQYIEGKMESWFAETYMIGDCLKKYIEDQKIVPGKPINVDQAIGLLKIINAIEAHKLKVARAWFYVRKNPDEFTDTARDTNKAISKALHVIETILKKGYPEMARQKLESYIKSRQAQTSNFGFDGEVKHDEALTKTALIDLLKSNKHQDLSARYLARVRWKLAIAEVIKKNRTKNERWNDANDTVKNYYSRIDEEVKLQVRDIVQDQYGVLLKQHEAFIKWLNLFEEAVLQAEKNISIVFQNLDEVANRRAKLIQMLLRASVSAALSPFLLQNFIDPTLSIFNDVISQLNLHNGDIELDLSQSQTLYQMTGFLPDPNKRTYRDAYQKLSNETFYDNIERYKKYLKHKIDSLSETRELCEMMSEDSGLWGEFTTQQIMHAHQMQVLNAGHYGHSTVRLKHPENENAMISAMVKPFETMIKNAFEPMQTQYGNRDNLRALCQFIDKITFDDNRKGPESHRHFENNALVKMMSFHVEIFLIVKHLVENSPYFGSNSQSRRLHHGNFKMHPEDTSFGLRAEDTSTREIVSALLKRLMQIDNPALKKTLELDIEGLSENKIIKRNPLMQSSSTETARNGCSRLIRHCFSSHKVATTENQRKRQEMITAIIEEYYNQDISLLLQRQVIAFAKIHGVNLAVGSQHMNDSIAVIQPKWLSENDLKNHVKEQIKPFIQQAEEQQQLNEYCGSHGLHYYRNRNLISEASNTRAIERTEENISKQGSRFIFKG